RATRTSTTSPAARPGTTARSPPPAARDASEDVRTNCEQGHRRLCRGSGRRVTTPQERSTTQLGNSIADQLEAHDEQTQSDEHGVVPCHHFPQCIERRA